MVVFWLPYRNSEIGRAAFAVGSNESAAYMSGVRVNRAKLVAYVMGGLFSGTSPASYFGPCRQAAATEIQAGTYT